MWQIEIYRENRLAIQIVTLTSWRRDSLAAWRNRKCNWTCNANCKTLKKITKYRQIKTNVTYFGHVCCTDLFFFTLKWILMKVHNEIVFLQWNEFMVIWWDLHCILKFWRNYVWAPCETQDITEGHTLIFIGQNVIDTKVFIKIL